MNINKVKKALEPIYKIQYSDKNRLVTYENKFVTFKRLPLNNDLVISRFNEGNWKQINKFVSSIKPYDKYLDSEILIKRDLLVFNTDNKFEYNVTFNMRLANFNNMNIYSISYKDLTAINRLVKEFGKVKSITFYKYSKTVVKLLFNKHEIYMFI